MKHKHSALLLAAVLGAAALPLHAANFTFDFEGVPASGNSDGALTTLTMDAGGLSVTITRSTGATFDVADESGGAPASFGSRTLSPFSALPAGDFFIATFSSPINAANISFGDFGPSDDDSPVTLKAFAGANATGVQIDGSSASYDANTGFPTIGTLGVSGAGIESLAFTSGGTFPNSLFWDNLNVSTSDSTNSVPDAGSSMSLLAVSLTGIAGLRRWIKRA